MSLKTQVRNEYGKLRSVLLCRPEFFELQPINEIAKEHLRKGERPDKKRVLEEHAEFVKAIEEQGVSVVWVEPAKEFPYQVFTRDIGVTTPEGVLLGSFRYPVRRGEERIALRALEPNFKLWKEIGSLSGIYFEGGDFIYLNSRMAAVGTGARTNAEGARRISKLLREIGLEVIPVSFEKRYLHLDMVFNVVAEKVAVLCPEALPENFLKLIRKLNFELIEETPEGVFKLNCNLLALDSGLLLSPLNNKGVNRRLKTLGFRVIEVRLEHLLMGGGGPHCLSFPLYREG